ncbi:hypothetical protein COO60DRAFT_1644285 [Scenedesmus sp. NREL 46B-D3]|nr:hypothetical protein COO60DRAFT_1644285 [Scenedesmus sp. NREL 46B-D3]
MSFAASAEVVQILGPLATVIGAAGCFPAPPKVFASIAERYPLLQWGLVYVLVWQGQGNRDEWVALWATAALYLIFRVLKSLGHEASKDAEE